MGLGVGVCDIIITYFLKSLVFSVILKYFLFNNKVNKKGDILGIGIVIVIKKDRI